MVSVQEASQIIQRQQCPTAISQVPLQRCVGRVLAESVFADRDFPPFDRAAMDGIGIVFSQWRDGMREFTIADTQQAGEPQKQLIDPTQCMEVMTGAMIPQGVDTIIRYEETTIQQGRATVLADTVKAGQHIHRRAQDIAAGTEILRPGVVLSPAEIALLASVGKSEVMVKLYPRIAIISTGNELVDINEIPLPHQIRKSNTYALHAALLQMGIASILRHVPDDTAFIEKELETILHEHDVVILSGGVSKGKFDFVPQSLEKLGVGKLFHRVNQRPGKPFWFGSSPSGKAVFALPGNPVSTYMCFYKYIQPWLYRVMGVEQPERTAILAQDVTFDPPMTYFLQVMAVLEEGRLMARPVAGGGSGDFANLSHVNGFLQLPHEKSHFKAGEVFPFIPFRLL